MHKKTVIKLSLLCLISGGYWLSIYLGISAIPFKVIAPCDPRFNPEKFRVKDYMKYSGEFVAAALRKTFPIGTSKSKVDEIWENNMGKKPHRHFMEIEYFEKKYTRYTYEGSDGAYIKGPPATFFLFDENMELINISSHMTDEKIYPNQLPVFLHPKARKPEGQYKAKEMREE